MPGKAVHLVERSGGLLKSQVTEQQLFEIPARPYFDLLIDSDARAWLKQLLRAAELVTIIDRIAACRDPIDDKFLELAVNGHADLIVSGDGDRLALNPFRQSRSGVVLPFVRRLALGLRQGLFGLQRVVDDDNVGPRPVSTPPTVVATREPCAVRSNSGTAARCSERRFHAQGFYSNFLASLRLDREQRTLWPRGS